jgi:hypothetical protein
VQLSHHFARCAYSDERVPDNFQAYRGDVAAVQQIAEAAVGVERVPHTAPLRGDMQLTAGLSDAAQATAELLGALDATTGTIAIDIDCADRAIQRRGREMPTRRLDFPGIGEGGVSMSKVSFGVFDWIDRGTQPLSQLYEERLQLFHDRRAGPARHEQWRPGRRLGGAPIGLLTPRSVQEARAAALSIFRGTRESNPAKREKSSVVDAGPQPPARPSLRI